MPRWSPAQRRKHSEQMRAAWNDPDRAARWRASIERLWTPERRARLSEAMSVGWAEAEAEQRPLDDSGGQS